MSEELEFFLNGEPISREEAVRLLAQEIRTHAEDAEDTDQR